jgi:hypothetical protein
VFIEVCEIFVREIVEGEIDFSYEFAIEIEKYSFLLEMQGIVVDSISYIFFEIHEELYFDNAIILNIDFIIS